MKWFKAVFPLKNPPFNQSEAEGIEPFSTSQLLTLAECKECTAPIAENTEPLNYGQIQHLVPLRHLDIPAISGLIHKTQTYAEQSVIFIYDQAAEYVYYLLAGTITILPNMGNSYQITAGSTRAHLPINSGQNFSATVVASTEVKILLVDADLKQLWTTKSKSEMNFVELMDLNLPESLASLPLIADFTNAYRDNKLSLPLLPDMGLGRWKEIIIQTK
ncbi:hypothetical protein [Methyloprofundus sp.]|uniref:hypothetical protein n=1 Tax=Methyloprofundus sp. TaxID=2020875 RepID=UPI003D14D50D